MKRINVLDCTLRDGGQGLEDFQKNGLETKLFSDCIRKSFINYLANSGIEIIEIGCIVRDSDNIGCNIFSSVEELSKYIPEKKQINQMYVGLFTSPDYNLEEVPQYKEGLVEGLRVILRYSELRKSLEFCRELAKKGYKVFIQPMLTMRYSNYDLDLVLNYANEIPAFALYFVDSFGYMTTDDVNRIFEYYDKKLNKDIIIGFHAHNNMQLAFENVRYFANKSSCGRNLLIDSCIMGMGQGAGNMQTELLVPYLNQNFNCEYSYNNVLNACELIQLFRTDDLNTWGYSPIRSISAVHKASYKFAVAMRKMYKMSYSEINMAFSKMPYEIKQRYTEDILKEFLKELGR